MNRFVAAVRDRLLYEGEQYFYSALRQYASTIYECKLQLFSIVELSSLLCVHTVYFVWVCKYL